VTESDSAAARKRPAKKAATKKTPAKKTATKKAPAKRSAPDKVTVKKTTRKQAPAKKAAVTATPTTRRSRRAAVGQLARSAPMSKYFTNARARAARMLDDPDALRKVADESFRSAASRSGPFAAVMDDFRTLVRLVVAYSRGNYRDIPPESLALVVAGLLYVVSPLDLIPDFVPGVGYLDDAVVVGWVIKSVRDELDAFRAWEVGH
jgi:uncharacterized membrane protein YkvA (DUF1232 family)